ncbi:hypothetical protein L2E82_41424 [Cichorium intybus]|uniref:Uncharacterized protein n=1 Tax=Cichorium intybus TaxID=13427 RepID=A0ACB9ANU8_CICIN|nr:hypothetical protein L2E82_41424 [Cichorium intybus]
MHKISKYNPTYRSNLIPKSGTESAISEGIWRKTCSLAGIRLAANFVDWFNHWSRLTFESFTTYSAYTADDIWDLAYCLCDQHIFSTIFSFGESNEAANSHILELYDAVILIMFVCLQNKAGITCMEWVAGAKSVYVQCDIYSDHHYPFQRLTHCLRIPYNTPPIHPIS